MPMTSEEKFFTDLLPINIFKIVTVEIELNVVRSQEKGTCHSLLHIQQRTDNLTSIDTNDIEGKTS